MSLLVAATPTTSDLFAAVKARVSIGEMLERHGLRHHGRSMQCPNFIEHGHGDRSLSAWISSSGRTWRCHGCGKGGSVVDVVSLVCGLSLGEAVRALCNYADIEAVDCYDRRTSRADLHAQPMLSRIARRPEPVPPPARPEVHALLRQCQDLLSTDPARQYLDSRGIPLSVAQAAGLGYAPRGTWPQRRGAGQPRIVAPLTTPGGILLTLYGRATVPCSKHLRHDLLPGTKGIFHACSLHEDGCILVEGLFDALACLAAGQPAAAINGLSFRDAWWAQMPSSRFILAADADPTGQQQSAALAEAAKQAGKHIHCLRPEHLAPYKDLNEYWVANQDLPRVLVGPRPPE